MSKLNPTHTHTHTQLYLWRLIFILYLQLSSLNVHLKIRSYLLASKGCHLTARMDLTDHLKDGGRNTMERDHTCTACYLCVIQSNRMKTFLSRSAWV